MGRLGHHTDSFAEQENDNEVEEAVVFKGVAKHVYSKILILSQSKTGFLFNLTFRTGVRVMLTSTIYEKLVNGQFGTVCSCT